MNNVLDFINSIGTIGFSSLKDRFALLNRDSYEGKFLLNVINAKPDRYYLVSKGDEFFSVRLQNLMVKYNHSLKDGEEILDFQKHPIRKFEQALYAKTFGKKVPAILSLPKKNYVEVRLLCGATLAQIKKEVADDKYHLDRINEFLDQWQLMRMFPPKVGKEVLYKGFRIISKEDAKRGLHNAVVDGYGRTIASIEEVSRPEDSYRNTYAISYILPFRQSEAQMLLREIGMVVGRQEEITFDDLKRWSNHINGNITDDAILFMTYATPSDRFINTGFKTGTDNPDSVVTDNSSSPYDDELTVRANDGPFEADPVTIIEPEEPSWQRPTLKQRPSRKNPSQLLLQFAEEGNDDNKRNNNLKNNDHGRRKDNGTEVQDIRPGAGQGDGGLQHDNEGGERKPQDTGADRGEPDMVPSPQATESYPRASEKGDDGDNGALSEGPRRVGRGGGRTTPSDGGGVDSGQGGAHPGRSRDDVHSLGGTPSGTDEDLRPAMVRGGVDDLPAPARRNGEVDARITSGVDHQGDGDRTRQDAVEDADAPTERTIFNEDAYIDSEHDVQVPKAGTLAAFKANVKAIATLADIIERGGIQPTKQEQETLKRFTGFGGLTIRFVVQHSRLLDWNYRRMAEGTFEEMKKDGLISDEEIAEAKNGVKNQTDEKNTDVDIDGAVFKLTKALHKAYMAGSINLYGFNEKTDIGGKPIPWGNYESTFSLTVTKYLIGSFISEGKYDYWTPKQVARLGGVILGEFGVKEGKLLEPSAGTGNMLHSFERDLISGFDVTCVEPNIVTGLINKMLNPSANVILSRIENAEVGRYTVTLTNMPFVDGLKVADKKFNNSPDKRYVRALSNLTGYFPLKMMEQTQPGGLMVCLSTTSFLNASKYEENRELMQEKMNFVGAVRFPSGIFPDTSVNTDFLIFQKKREGERKSHSEAFVKTTVRTLEENDTVSYKVNEYFVNHPENIIGHPEEAFRGVTYNSELGLDEIAAKAEELIRHIITDYKQKNDIEALQAQEVEETEEKPVLDMNERICADYVALKKVYNDLIKADINDYPNAEQLRQDLNTTYDSFVFKYGSLNEDRVRRRLSDDKPDFIKMLALENCKKRENLTGKNKTELIITKSDIFRHRTINRASSDIESNDPSDLVFHSFAKNGRIDTAFLRNRLGEDWLEKCDGLIFKNPETERYELYNIYLSGHIGDKLDAARLAAMGDDTYNKNVEALEKVLPKRIGIDEIIINMGTDIVPVAAYQNFIMTELMNVTSQSELRRMKCDISYNENHSWNISFTQKEQNLLRSYDVRRPDCNARRIIDAAFNDSHIKVTDKDEDGNSIVNESLTLIANTKVREIREMFETWVHTKASQGYMDDIEDNFNRRFNQYVATNWDNMRVSLEGCTKTPREHQKNVVARGLTNNDLLMHHAVGAGKTLAMGMTMMERIRLGIATKCCLLTMKANASQIAGEIQNAYPDAKILYPGEKDFDKENRNIFLNRIKHSDADIVILTHDQFNKIKHEDRFREMFVAWQIETIRELKAREETDGLTPAERKRLDKMEENLRNELENENEKLSKDEISWTELGFDNLAVDEAHLFKNLLFQTSHDKVKGINADSNSKRASHLFMAVRDIQEKNGGDKGVIFATGTPISNSLAELYNWQVYLVPNILKKQGINCFDKWADVFAQRQSDWEPDELGRSKLVERFRSFINLQPLLTAYRGFADVITEKDLIEKKLVVDKPKALYRQVIVPFDSKVDAAIFEELKNIMDIGHSEVLDVHLTEKSFSARSLVTLSKGTKASLTHKMLGLDDETYGTIHNKVDYVAKNVARIYRETQFAKGTQLIFSDSYQNGDYNLYSDIKNILSRRYGIPAREIVDINTVKEKDRASFFDRVNDGDVRVVLGSTQKLGTGVNVQKRACAAHMLDVNWTPSGMIQKTGRVARQGNEFAKQFLDNNVPVYLYVKERSTDAKKYGLIFAKQRMIEQITDSNFKGNRFDEGKSDTELESEIFQELLASATGDNTTMVLNKLTKQYQMLASEKKGFESYKYNINRNLQLAQMTKEEYIGQRYVIDRLARALSDKGFTKDEQGKYPFRVKFDGTMYITSKELGRAMIEEIARSIESKAFLSKKFEAYGLTAMLQGSKKDGYTVEITKLYDSDLTEKEKKNLALVKNIDTKTFHQDAESMGRVMNNLCLSVGERKKSITTKLDDIESTIQNLLLQQKKNEVFPKQEEMERMRSDIAILSGVLKQDNLDDEVKSVINTLENTMDGERLLLVRDVDKMKAYAVNMRHPLGDLAAKIGEDVKEERDNHSDYDILLIEEKDVDKVINMATNDNVVVAYLDNMSDGFGARLTRDNMRLVDIVTSYDQIKDMFHASAEAEKRKLEADSKRLDELRNTSSEESEAEEGEEVKQMNTNIITWRELGFPNPEDGEAITSYDKYYSLDNMPDYKYADMETEAETEPELPAMAAEEVPKKGYETAEDKENQGGGIASEPTAEYKLKNGDTMEEELDDKMDVRILWDFSSDKYTLQLNGVDIRQSERYSLEEFVEYMNNEFPELPEREDVKEQLHDLGWDKPKNLAVNTDSNNIMYHIPMDERKKIYEEVQERVKKTGENITREEMEKLVSDFKDAVKDVDYKKMYYVTALLGTIGHYPLNEALYDQNWELAEKEIDKAFPKEEKRYDKGNKVERDDNIASEPVAEYVKPKKEDTMEITKDKMDKTLEEFQRFVTAQEISLDDLETRMELRENVDYELSLMEGSVTDVEKMKKKMQEEIDRMKPSSEGNKEVKEYIGNVQKLQKRLNANTEFNLRMHLGDEKYDEIAATVNGDGKKTAKAEVKEGQKKGNPGKEEPGKAEGKKEQKPAKAEQTAQVEQTKKQVEKKQVEKKEKVEEKKPAEQKQETGNKLPELVKVGYAQYAGVKDTQGNQLELIVPKFRIQLDLNSIEQKMDKMRARKTQSGEDFLSFAIIKNKQAKENQSPLQVIVKRHGEDATVNGKTVKFADAAALMEFQVSLQDLKAKAEKAGIDTGKEAIPLSVGSYSGETGIKLNNKSALLKDKELKDEDMMIRGRFKVVNSFDRIVKTKQNLDEVPAIRYDNKDMGDCITNSREVNIRKKDGTSFAKTVEDIYVALSSKALKELPEADAFGNVKLAICTKRTDEKYLTANKLQLNEQGQLVNEQGRRVPNLLLVADPKTYKNGQPYANTERVLTIRKEDLVKLPTLDDKNGTIALRIDGLTNKVALNVNKYVTENRTQEVEKYLQSQSGDKNAKIDPKRPYDTNVTISAVSEHYSAIYAKMEVNSWEKITPKVDLETYKNAPSQFELFKEVVSDYMEKKANKIKESAAKNAPEEDAQEETQKQGRKI